MKKTIIIIFGLFAAVAALAQATDHEELSTNYPDSLVLTMDNGNEIHFLFHRMSQHQEYISNDLWKSMLSIMETTVERSDIQEGIQVKYETVSGSARITITELTPQKSVFVIQNDGMREQLSSRVEFLIVQPEVAVSFSVQSGPELEEIKTLNLTSVWEQTKEKFENHGKVNLYRGTGTIKYGEVSIKSIEARKPQLDNLEITFLGVGLGYYRDQFIPDLGSKLAFKMHNRLGEDWIDFGFLYTQQFIYTRTENSDFTMDWNGWLTTYFKVYLADEGEFGLGVGGLVHRQGDFYENATFKLSLYGSKSKSRFSYSPELIFSNDFKEFFPAFRIGLSF